MYRASLIKSEFLQVSSVPIELFSEPSLLQLWRHVKIPSLKLGIYRIKYKRSPVNSNRETLDCVRIFRTQHYTISPSLQMSNSFH